MRNFLKAACVLLVVSATGFAQFAQEANVSFAQELTPQQIQLEFKRYKRMKQAGNGLIIAGSASAATSLIFGIAESKQTSHNKHDDYRYRAYEAVGFSLLIFATPTFLGTGIPLRVIGGTRSKRLENALPNSAYVAPNGVNFTWNF